MNNAISNPGGVVTLAGMNGSRAQRYRPAADFDDATLARKREYWRTKKREQRAKLSALKKEKPGTKGTTDCKQALAASAVFSEASAVLTRAPAPARSLQCHGLVTAPLHLLGPALLNSDGSYQAAVTSSSPGFFGNNPQVQDNKGSLLSPVDGVQDWESTGVMAPVSVSQLAPPKSCLLEEGRQTLSNEKESSLQRVKLQKNVLQFPKTCSESLYDPDNADVSKDVVKCLPLDAERGTFSTTKPNGALFNSCSQVPAAQMELQFNSSFYSQDQNDTSLVHDSSASVPPQYHTDPQVTLGQTNNCCTQVGTQPRDASLSLLKTGIATKVKIKGDPTDVITSQISGSKSTNLAPLVRKSKPHPREPPAALKGSQTSGVIVTLDTEEEKAARRREYWRIKKREQRAKLTARLAKVRDKMRTVTTAMQKTEPSSCMVLERPSAWCKDGQRQPGSRVRTPLIPVSLQKAGRLLRNARAVAVSCSASKYSSITVKKEPSHSSAILCSPAPSCYNQPAVATKTERSHETPALKGVAAGTFPHSAPKLQATIGHQKRQDTDERWGSVRSKTPRQRFLETQRMMSHRSMRKPFSHAATLLTPYAKRGSAEETAEEKLARKREYWRIKKREQRAKLSAEVKARLKERDALLRRVKRYQCILEEMRRARAGTGNRGLQPAGNALTGDVEAIGGFIKEDGTVTTEIPQTSTHLRLLGPKMTPELLALPVQNADVSANASKASLVSCVKVNVSTSLRDSTQVKDSHQLGATRTVFRNVAKNSQNLDAAAPQVCVAERHPQSVQSTYPRITLIKPAPNVSPINRVVENVSLTALKERPSLMVAPSTSGVAVKVPCRSAQLTEEERMAKKREYWRIKKREQRAKRSARGREPFKHTAAILGQQNHRVPLNRNTIPLPLAKSEPLSKPDSELSISPQGNVKQERESSLSDDCPASPSLCQDIKPPPLSPSEMQTEPDQELNMDSQEATLLAVASMKKLLEESLSTVTDCNGLSSGKSEVLPCKREEEATDLDIKPSLQCPLGESQEAMNAGQKQQEMFTCPKSPCDRPLNEATVLTSSHKPSEVPSTSQVPSHMCSTGPDPSPPARCSKHRCIQPPPLRRALRLRAKRTGHCCSPEPPKQLSATSQPDEDILQKKREYWRVMKREQRARKAAREKEIKKQRAITSQTPVQLQEDRCWKKQEQMASKAVLDQEVRRDGPAWASKPVLLAKAAPQRPKQQGQNICLVKLQEPAPPLQCLLPTGGGSLVSPLSTLLVVNPSSNSFRVESDAGKPLDGTSQGSPGCGTKPEVEAEALPGPGGSEGRILLLDEDPSPSPKSARVRRWRLQAAGGTVTPPGQLTSHSQTPRCSSAVGAESRRRLDCQSPPTKTPPCTKQAGTAPKVTRTPAEVEEDLRQKKREYWRGRKREQRARKAARERQLKLEGAEGHARAEGLGQGQDSSLWFNDAEDPSLCHSTSLEDNPGLLPQLYQTGDVKGEGEVEFLGEEEDEEEDSVATPTSAAMWRSRFLMDYDPLNQLLVCMVCGELQHSHTLEGVRAHIEEAHPNTASLGPREHRHIQEAWDEQVSVRERFFSSQMQQQEDDDPPAEVEVLVDLEDFTAMKNTKSKNRTPKKV
ncbi:uncharacterized protein si:dkey-28a3.2 isoform X2 [Brienomyrus brachyistius]|uniref:uncharacterized protein si:dkey-28a3.2 isoform X2 n=1 Tax=Brienomyrus brachyistius TaxID=42636 RepID=UPI0020B32D46|nr:uncharacterized protein si:dkey-28a3.2 isoform X2 [Brienomyrus brachyistius]